MKFHFHVFKLNSLLVIFCLFLLFIFSSIYIYYVFSFDTSNQNPVPIVMYHSILKDTSKSGKYVVTPTTLENDLKYISEKGYTTITTLDLINYVYDNVPLPEKSIILTFDDGYYNNLTYLIPLIEKYNMKAVISIVGKYTDTFSKADEANANYGHLRWKDINELLNSGKIEFGNHSYNLHKTINGRKGSMKKFGESLDSYKTLLNDDLGKLQNEFKENTNFTPYLYTYPYGAISKESINIIKQMGFKVSLSCIARNKLYK